MLEQKPDHPCILYLVVIALGGKRREKVLFVQTYEGSSIRITHNMTRDVSKDRQAVAVISTGVRELMKSGEIESIWHHMPSELIVCSLFRSECCKKRGIALWALLSASPRIKTAGALRKPFPPINHMIQQRTPLW